MSNKVGPLTQDERNKVNNTAGLQDVLNGAKQLARTSHFEIGDVLVAQDEKGNLCQLSGANGNCPKKFLVIDKDAETGVVYAKGINANGKLGVKIEVLASWPVWWTFVCDPDLAEAVLFDNEDGYDAFAAAKKLKKDKDKVKRYNGKIRCDTDRYEKGLEFVKSINNEDRIWVSYGWIDTPEEYEVIEAKALPLDTKINHWGHRPDEDYRGRGMSEKPYIKAKKVGGKYGVGNIVELDKWYLERFVYKQRPYTLEDVENIK